MLKTDTASEPRLTRSGFGLRPFTGLLIGISSVTWMGTSIYVPALSIIETELGLNASQVGATLTIYYVCYALFMPLVGPLSDAWGRRGFLLAGSVLFLLGSVSCMLAGNVVPVYLGRGLQGIGAGMLQVPILAMVSDECRGRIMYRILGLLGALTAIIPALAMIIGGAVAHFGRWRPIFLFLTLASLLTTALCLLVLKETLPEERRGRIAGLLVVLAGYRNMLLSRQMLAVGAPLILSACALGAFYTTAPFIVNDTFHLSTLYLGVVNILFVLAAAAGQYLSSLSIRRVSSSSVYLFGGMMALAGGTAFAVLDYRSAISSLAVISTPLAMFAFSFGFMEPAGLKSILTHFENRSGMASALYGSLLLLLQGLGSQVAGILMNIAYPPVTSLALVMAPVTLLMAVAALAARDSLR
ncbi:MAG: MFS transporter [Gammaproteobacteria bacterium]|nr:MFS transporter [Gammaproteobacteria bacterium]